MKEPDVNRPNILLICSDQEFAHFAEPSGYHLPGRDRLKIRGVSFDQFQANTTVCTSARSVIYTGQHAPRTGMWDNFNFSWIGDLDPSISTIGHMLRQEGYYTAYKGRWLLSALPEQGTLKDLEIYGFADYQDHGDLWGRAHEGFERDSEVAQEASRWLLERTRGISSTQPWFLAVNFVNPHDIAFFDTDESGHGHGPGALKNRGAPEEESYLQWWQPSLPSSFDDDLLNHPEGVSAYGRYVAGIHGFIPHERHDLWQTHINYYLNCLQDNDRQLGILLDAVEDAGLWDSTIIVFTSDHGEMGTAHGLRLSGGVAFREAVNIPFVVCHPEYGGGRVSQALGSALDIAPTLLSFSGLTASEIQRKHPQLKGRDLSGIVADPKSDGPRGSGSVPGDGVLYTYDMIHSLDVEWFIGHIEQFSDLRYALGTPLQLNGTITLKDVELPGLSRRRMFRGVFDGRYKFIRYFSPDHYHTPHDLDEIYRFNDVALYDLYQDQDELINLARQDQPEHDESLILAMNQKMNRLIADELGEDGSVLELLLK